MRTIYFDCYCGASGDMIVGSLLDLGLSIEALSSELAKLSVKNFQVSASKVTKGNLAATKFDVQTGQEHVHRNYFTIADIIEKSSLSGWVKERATRIFLRLGEAEARVHGTTLETIHFHEVGALDAIVDVVGACIGFELLGVEDFFASPLNVGKGTTEGAHGVMPVPAPATAELLKGFPIYSNEVSGELVTPTGAAIITTLCQSFRPLALFRIQSIGYGAGSRDLPDRANVLRVYLEEAAETPLHPEHPAADEVVLVVEGNIDDLNPQVYGYLQGKMLGLGALDFYVTPVQMKKNRPGTLLTVVTPANLLELVCKTLFEETSTIGLRYYETRRKVLERLIEQVESEWGPVRVKVSKHEGQIVNFSPEYEDCRRLAEQHHVPLKWIQSRVVQNFMNQYGKAAIPSTR